MKLKVRGKFYEVRDKDCANKSCFCPHDMGYRLSSGKWHADFCCAIREQKGCPEVRKLYKELKNRDDGRAEYLRRMGRVK